MAAQVEEPIAWLVDVPPDEMRRIVDALYRVHRLIASITDLDALLPAIMEESKQVASAEGSSLMLFDEKSRELYFHVALGEQGEQHALKKIRLKLDEGVAGACATARRSINVPDAAREPRVYREADRATRFETRSLLAVPLLDRDKLVGVVEVVNKLGGGPFSDFDQRILEMFSALTATTIVNARLIDENLRSTRLAAIGHAVAGLSHHIKNILTGMKGSIELIDLGLQKGDGDILRRGWGILKRSVARISGVVEDMLAYSKPRKPIYEYCDLRALFEDVVASYRDTFEKKSGEISFDLDKIRDRVRLDPRGIHRVLLNLISNACDAAPKKGGRIHLHARLDPNKDLVIEVTDNGPGVPLELRPLIFDPFFSTKGSGGTGLGLAVSHKIVTEHEGDIAVEDAPGGGAVFRLRIPQRRA